jgi:hypothetical protein
VNDTAVPDLLYGRWGFSFPLEVKGKYGKLTTAQEKFFGNFSGFKEIVKTEDDCSIFLDRLMFFFPLTCKCGNSGLLAVNAKSQLPEKCACGKTYNFNCAAGCYLRPKPDQEVKTTPVATTTEATPLAEKESDV